MKGHVPPHPPPKMTLISALLLAVDVKLAFSFTGTHRCICMALFKKAVSSAIYIDHHAISLRDELACYIWLYLSYYTHPEFMTSQKEKNFPLPKHPARVCYSCEVRGQNNGWSTVNFRAYSLNVRPHVQVYLSGHHVQTYPIVQLSS